jgi:hypothetical protein
LLLGLMFGSAVQECELLFACPAKWDVCVLCGGFDRRTYYSCALYLLKATVRWCPSHLHGTAAAKMLPPARPQAHAKRWCYFYQVTFCCSPCLLLLLLLLCVSFPATGAAFLQCLEVSLAVPKALPGSKQLRARFIAFLHRLVESLMATVLPYLPAALEALMAREADVTDVTDVLTLLVQLITRFKEALGKLVEVVLPIAVARVHGLLGECLMRSDAARVLCYLLCVWVGITLRL